MTHIRTFQALAVAAGLVFGAQGASAQTSGSALYTTCKRSLSLLMGGNFNSPAVLLQARRACIDGIRDGWNAVAHRLCGEGTPSVGQLEEIFVSWAGQHPAEAGVSVREATRRAFSQAFPCRRAGATRPPPPFDPSKPYTSVKVYPNGDHYEGEFRDDKASGHGVATFANGNHYEGEFRDNKANGRGVYTWPSGNRYEGEFRDNKLNGWGVHTYANGVRYEGWWRDSCFLDGGRWVALDQSVASCPH